MYALLFVYNVRKKNKGRVFIALYETLDFSVSGSARTIKEVGLFVKVEREEMYV